MIAVEKQLQAPCNPKKGVEAHFMRLDEAMENSKCLKDKHTEKQLINYALQNFNNECGREMSPVTRATSLQHFTTVTA